ncbi:MAG TPA: pseudouridine synthase, partial [Marinilabiliaceae bacterium]|nr:pseudouridine synthase [Marinilabiliaceae bacterium]
EEPKKRRPVVKLNKPKQSDSPSPDKNVQKSAENESKPGIRLNKYISNSGVCSRRDADALISSGQITVNGKVVTELGTRVQLADDVQFNNQKLNPESKVYILLNKPKNTVTTSSDPEGRRTVLDIIEDACDERVYPVGRLDRNTTGLLLLTNDGDLSKKLTHPSYEVRKIYHAQLDKPLTKAHLDDIRRGVELEDGLMEVDEISYVNTSDSSEVGVEIHSGRNRIVRRLFEHLGYTVEKLDRVYFSGLTKKHLPRGKWRFLTADEIKFLKAGMLK